MMGFRVIHSTDLWFLMHFISMIGGFCDAFGVVFFGNATTNGSMGQCREMPRELNASITWSLVNRGAPMRQSKLSWPSSQWLLSPCDVLIFWTSLSLVRARFRKAFPLQRSAVRRGAAAGRISG